MALVVYDGVVIQKMSLVGAGIEVYVEIMLGGLAFGGFVVSFSKLEVKVCGMMCGHLCEFATREYSLMSSVILVR